MIAPGKSDRQIAATAGVSPTTVGTARQEMVSTGQLSKLDSSIGADGKTRPRSPKIPPGEEPEHRNDRRRFLVWALMAGLVPPERVTERILQDVAGEGRE